LGVLPATTPIAIRDDEPLFELSGANAFVYATADGIFEPFHLNGATVHAGEAAGRIHCIWDPTRPPEMLHYQVDGMLYGRRQPGRVRPGNCCLVVATPYVGDLSRH
jgi:predicted deacylase